MTEWRPATDEELRSYYRSVFPQVTDRLHQRFKPPGPKEYGLAFREPFPCVGDEVPAKDFIRRSTWTTEADTGEKKYPQFTGWEDFIEFVQTPARGDPLDRFRHALADPALLANHDAPVPEAVYYSLAHWDRPWIPVVDIDAKDVAAQRECPEAEIVESPPEGYAYRFEDLERAIEYGFETERIFSEQFAAEATEVVYSGQGVHVYLFDTDRFHRYDQRSREVITTVLETQFGIPLDAVVTTDPARFGRLPYSLHGEVARVVQPIDPGFDPRTDGLPPFLGGAVESFATKPSTTEVNV